MDVVEYVRMLIIFGFAFTYWNSRIIFVVSGDGVNIALGKYTSQVPNTHCNKNCSLETKGFTCSNSSLAVDGDLSTCSRTTDKIRRRYAQWDVLFQGHFYLSTIKIVPSNDNVSRDSLEGLTVYGLPLQVIYKASRSDARRNNATISIPVPASLRNMQFTGVSIYAPGRHNVSSAPIPHLSLCEVQVFMAPNCTIHSLDNGIILWNNSVFTAKAIPDGTTLEYRCNTGYTLNTPRILTCTVEGLSSGGIKPTCSNVIDTYYGLIHSNARAKTTEKVSLDSNSMMTSNVYKSTATSLNSATGAVHTTSGLIPSNARTKTTENVSLNSNSMMTVNVNGSTTTGLTPLTGGLIGAGLVALIFITGVLLFVFIRQKRRKANTESPYETTVYRDESSPYSTIDVSDRSRNSFQDTGGVNTIYLTPVQRDNSAYEDIMDTDNG